MRIKLFLSVILLLISYHQHAFAQSKVEWQNDYQFTVADFKGTVPKMVEDNVQRYYLACQFDFFYQMTTAQFMLTKNFNQYVSAYFYPYSSWIEDGEDTETILMISKLNFDLVELQARKFRKQIYENKKAFSSPEFSKRAYQIVSDEYIQRVSEIESTFSTLDTPALRRKVEEYQRQVAAEIEELADFCKMCKPKKIKKVK